MQGTKCDTHNYLAQECLFTTREPRKLKMISLYCLKQRPQYAVCT